MRTGEHADDRRLFWTSLESDQHLSQHIEHWRWKQYWEGMTGLGALYVPGREFSALLFWHTDETGQGWRPDGVYCGREQVPSDHSDSLGTKRVLIQHALTHQEYEKGDWKQ